MHRYISTHRQAEEVSFNKWTNSHKLYPRPRSSLPSERLWIVIQLQHDSFCVQSPLTQDDSSTCLCGNTLVFKLCLWSLALVESCFHRQHSIFHLLLCTCIPRG